jgi:hypothetical protein
MRTVTVQGAFPGTVAEAERCWYDTGRWDRWVDGLEYVVAVDGPWPSSGSAITWVSNPAGRGRVSERVVDYEPLRGQTVEVSDDSISGRQSVAFSPVQEGVEVALSLDYEITRRNPLTTLVDLLFIRRAFITSLQSTVARFGTELQAGRAAS